VEKIAEKLCNFQKAVKSKQIPQSAKIRPIWSPCFASKFNFYS
jgi:hypothetical protein